MRYEYYYLHFTDEKLKHKQIKWLTQAHMASLWQSLLLNPGSLDFEFILVLIILF